MERRKHLNKMSLTDLWIVLLGCLALCQAAPTIAPTVSPEDQDLAEVMQHMFCMYISSQQLSVVRKTYSG